MKQQLAKTLTVLFSMLLTICLILALLAGGGFLLAFLVGETQAVRLCAFLNGTMLPGIYIVGAGLSILGVIKMYLAGEKSFFLERKRK